MCLYKVWGFRVRNGNIDSQIGIYKDVENGPCEVCMVQSFGDFQNFHPHRHVLATDGCFYKPGAFMVCPPPKTDELEELFRQ